MTSFRIVKGPVNEACAVPGIGARYGAAWGPQADRTNVALMSFGYAESSGIVTIDPATSEFTLSHVPPEGLVGEGRQAQIDLLLQHAAPYRSFVLLVGGLSPRRGDDGPASGPCVGILREAGFPAVADFTGPSGQSCDVAVSANGIWIATRPPATRVLLMTFVGAAGLGVPVDAPSRPRWFIPSCVVAAKDEARA